MDDLFYPDEDTTETKLSKFKPKARANPAKFSNRGLSKASHDSILASHAHSMQEAKNQSDRLVSEAVPSNSNQQKYAGEDAELSSNLDSSDDHLVRGTSSQHSSLDPPDSMDHDDPLLEAGKQVSADRNVESIILSNMESHDDNRCHSSVSEVIIFPTTTEEQADLAEAAKTASKVDVVDYEAKCKAVNELEQQVEDRPTYETVGVVESGKSSRKLRERVHKSCNNSKSFRRLRKRVHKSCTDDKSSRKLRKKLHKSCTDTEDTTDDDWNDEDFEILEMDDIPSDMEYQDEDMWYRKKPKKQISKTEKLKQKCKTDSNESNSTQEQPKNKLPHGTQHRRQVNKGLLQAHDDETNVRQLAIKDLIRLAEAKEKILRKTATALGKSFSNRSQGTMSSNSDDYAMREEEETNHCDNGANERFQVTQTKLNYQSYMTKTSGVRWSKSEIDLLYQAIGQFGTDFTMIQQLFPNRTRHQVKLKFKNEERKHPLQVQDALLHRCNDNAHFKQVIERLNIKPNETSKDADSNIETTLQDPKDENFKKDEGDPRKDEDDSKGMEDQGAELNVNKCIPKNPENSDGLDGDLFDWDAGDNYSEGMEEYAS